MPVDIHPVTITLAVMFVLYACVAGMIEDNFRK
jgi:hypothetical protein